MVINIEKYSWFVSTRIAVWNTWFISLHGVSNHRISAVYLDEQHRKHQGSTLLVICEGIHWWLVSPMDPLMYKSCPYGMSSIFKHVARVSYTCICICVITHENLLTWYIQRLQGLYSLSGLTSYRKISKPRDSGLDLSNRLITSMVWGNYTRGIHISMG